LQERCVIWSNPLGFETYCAKSRLISDMKPYFFTFLAKRFPILLFTFLSINTYAQSVVLDENYNDWKTIPVQYADKIGDGNASGIDFRDIKITNDEDRLFVYFDVTTEMNLDENNQVTLYVDADNNALTGLNRYGIGAELVFNMGDRKGIIYTSSGTTHNVFHHHIGLNISPTVSGSLYEMSFNKLWRFSNKTLSLQSQIKLVLADESIAGDRAPDLGGGIGYTMDQSLTFPRSVFSIEKENPEAIRVLSYNVLRDNLFETSLTQPFQRIFKAIQPDIIGFCEIYDYSGTETAAKVAAFIPLENGKTWYSASVDPDIRLVSRYPVTASASLDGNGAFLLNVKGKPLVCIVAHLPCCANETGRQREIDRIMSFVRSVKYGISTFQVPQNTPIIIMGDMNLVGLSEQQKTLLTGDIKNNSEFGPDEYPDWDDTSLEDAMPVTTNLPATFTWFNAGSTYGPGRLDYILYTGSVMESVNQYSLWSPALTQEQLATSGLQKEDVPTVSDHLPVVCDFFIPGISSSYGVLPDMNDFSIFQIGSEVIVRCAEEGEILVFDSAGRKILNEKIGKNDLMYEKRLEGFRTQGLYFITFLSEKQQRTKRLLIRE
jgi:exonuclease III